MKEPYSGTDAANAERLRQQMEMIYGTTPSGSLVFVPGLLIGLRLLFAGLGIKKIAISSEEYYTKEHFQGLNVTTFPPARAVHEVCKSQPRAVIASVVTWRGKETKISKYFSDIRRKMGKRCPLLIADYSHAGSIGWPLVSGFNADVVCGDPSKWIAASTKPTNIGFMWFHSKNLSSKAESIFAPYYLALDKTKITPQSRWIDPFSIAKLSEWYAEKNIDRAAMQEMFCNNIAFAIALSKRWHLDHLPRTAILWIKKAPDDPLFYELKELGLVLEMDGGFRIAARVDILKAARNGKRKQYSPCS